MARKANKSSQSRSATKPTSSSLADARKLIDEIEKSQIPFGESAPIFSRIKAQVDAGNVLSAEDHDHLQGLVKKAKEWEKGVQSSAGTQPEETMGG